MGATRWPSRWETVRAAMGAGVVGAAARRARRERQWWGERAALRATVGPPEVCPFVVAEHASPTRRTLAGVDPQLQVNKETNLAIAAREIDGLVLGPGQLFSFWQRVRRPTAARGFLPGVVLDRGHVTSGIGGGLCQLTNLLYWMTLHTPLTVTERWRHSYDVFPDSARTLPFASGATCAWPSLDLQVRNETTDCYRVSVTVVDGELRGRWSADAAPTRRYRVYETGHVVRNDAPGVHTRHNVLRRLTFDADGSEIGDELVAENHALMMYEPFLGAAPVRLPLDPPGGCRTRAGDPSRP